MTVYRPRAPTVEARQWTGENGAEMRAWLGYSYVDSNGWVCIENRAGRVVAYPGDWIVKLDGTFAVYEPQLFHAAYEAVT